MNKTIIPREFRRFSARPGVRLFAGEFSFLQLRAGAAPKTLVAGRELAKLRLANMLKVKVHEAKTNLSRLLARVETGEEIVILRGDNPVAKLVPAGSAPKMRRAGRLKNQAKLDASFFDPLPETELKRWEGK